MSNLRFESFWMRAGVGSVVAVLLMSGINAGLMNSGLGNVREFLLGAVFGALALAVSMLLMYALAFVVRRLPPRAMLLLSAALLALCFLLEFSPARLMRAFLDTDGWSLPTLGGAFSLASLAIVAVAMGALLALISAVRDAGIGVITQRSWRFPLIGTAVLVLAALVITAQLASEGHDPYANDGAKLAAKPPRLGLEDPSATGVYAVQSLSYGAGENLRRPEFGTARDLESRTVDASRLLPEWKGFKQKMREDYWGFGLQEAPLNGQVWAPEGAGPFPLVLIVHGNHGMEDYSDGGYAYLGERLASQGFIVVSVDQNYINGSWSGDFQGKEMAARGWLLLEHLALWRDWNDSADHPFGARVDMREIALVGHSRGGEAVAIAHRFNSLPNFPDDARVNFDYGFSIRALVAIAQVDQRYHRRVQLEDVNFFTIHGSYDSDEPAYHGLRQMNRIALSGDAYFLKAGLYLHGANHGQFNTGWGRYDYSPPGSWTLNTAPMIPGDLQRSVAAVYIAAFLRATLQRDDEYLALLKDPRVGAAWLPEATYVNQFVDSTFLPLADFDEDIDVATGSHRGSRITTQGLALWREEALLHRDNRPQGSNALVVGWRDAGAQVAISVGDLTGVSADRSLVFAVSGSTENLPAVDAAQDDAARADIEPEATPTIADFSIELRDRRGATARVLASDYAQLVPPVRVQYLKNAADNTAAYNRDWEPVLQHVEIPLAEVLRDHPKFRVSELQEVRLVFDQAAQGVLIFDEIGVSKTRPAAGRR